MEEKFDCDLLEADVYFFEKQIIRFIVQLFFNPYKIISWNSSDHVPNGKIPLTNNLMNQHFNSNFINSITISPFFYFLIDIGLFSIF